MSNTKTPKLHGSMIKEEILNPGKITFIFQTKLKSQHVHGNSTPTALISFSIHTSKSFSASFGVTWRR
jgi:hypothetical protein